MRKDSVVSVCCVEIPRSELTLKLSRLRWRLESAWEGTKFTQAIKNGLMNNFSLCFKSSKRLIIVEHYNWNVQCHHKREYALMPNLPRFLFTYLNSMTILWERNRRLSNNDKKILFSYLNIVDIFHMSFMNKFW